MDEKIALVLLSKRGTFDKLFKEIGGKQMIDWVNACFGESNCKKLDVMFRGRYETATYTDGILHYLIEDRAVEIISDHETGEILYERDEHGTM